jgi:hypothetical protein
VGQQPGPLGWRINSCQTRCRTSWLRDAHCVDVDELRHALGGIVLEAAHQTNRERNRVIHDTWATRPGNLMVTLKGGRTSHEVTVTARTLAEVRRLADQLADASDGLRVAMAAALGSGWVLAEDQLRQELGHEINTDLGN